MTAANIRTTSVPSKALAFVIRSLRQESRLLSHYVLRFLLASVVLSMLVMQVTTASLRASAGGVFASRVLICSYWFITILGGIYFASAIVEEKEEQTLPLLRMTGASTIAILLGKSIPRLACVILFLICITPFLFLAVTLGGVVISAIAQTIVAILIYAVMMSQIGLLSGLISRNSERAFSKTMIFWICIEFFPSLCWVGSQLMLAWTGLRNLTEAEAVANAANSQAAGVVAETGYSWGIQTASWCAIRLSDLATLTEDWVLGGGLSATSLGFASQTFWTPQMTFHLTLSAIAFFFSWLLFDRFTREAIATGNAPPISKLTRAARRSWSRALSWKVWQFHTGGQLWFWIRLLVVPLFVVVVGATVMFAIDEPITAEVLGVILIVGGIPMAIGHATVLFGRVFSSEVHERTLGTLLMLPVGRNRLFVDLVRGVLPAVVAACSTLVLGFIALWQDEPDPWRRIWEVVQEPWTWQIVMMWIVAIYLGMLFSIRLRYGGMLLSVVSIFFLAPYMTAFAFFAIGTLFIGFQDLTSFFEFGLPLLLIQLEIPLCIWLHLRILKALDRAGAKS